MNRKIKNIFSFGILFCFIFSVLSCIDTSMEKYYVFENGDFGSKIITVDRNNKINENIVDPRWGFSESSDFKIIYIKSENYIEGFLLVNNVYNKKYISRKEYMNMTIEVFDNYNNLNTPFHIDIKIIDDKIVIEYNNKIYSINTYFNYDQDYSINKEKYLKEYNIFN